MSEIKIPQESESQFTAKDYYQVVWDHINSENDLLNQKLSSLIGSQSFLFLGYVGLLNSPESLRADFLGSQHHLLLWIFPIIAVVIVIFMYFSMISSQLLVKNLARTYAENTKSKVLKNFPALGANEKFVNLSNGSIVILPPLLACAWIILIIQQFKLDV